MFENRSSASARSPSLEPFLGLERSSVGLPEMAPGASSDLVFLLWEHSPSRVPLAEARLRSALSSKRDCRKVCILFENCLEGSEKRRMEGMIRDYLAGRIDVEEGSSTSGSVTLLGAVRAIHSIQRDTGAEVDFRFIDIDDAELCAASHSALSLRDAARDRLQSVKDARREDIVSLFADPDRFLSDLLGRVRELVERQRDAIGRTRNDTMRSQIAAVRCELPEEIPIVVMIGAAHAEVAAHFARRAGFAFENVALPEEFLTAAPLSYRLTFPGPSLEAEAMREPDARTLSDDALAFEWMVGESLFELGACAKESFAVETKFLADSRVCQVLARVFCSFLGDALASAELQTFATCLFGTEEPEDETRFAMWRHVSGVIERELGAEVSCLESIPRLHRAIFDRLVAVESA